MDAGKVAKMAIEYATGLAADDSNKDGLMQLATKWINDHQKSPFTMAAITDAKALQVNTVSSTPAFHRHDRLLIPGSHFTLNTSFSQIR